jgi:hypothetical protein
MYYSGTRGRTGQAGTGFLVTGKNANLCNRILAIERKSMQAESQKQTHHSNQLLCPN